MRRRTVKAEAIAILATLLAFGFAGNARAQGFISPIIGYDFGGDTGCPNLTGCKDKKLNAGVAFGSIGSFLGFEEELAYAKNFFGDAPGLSSSVLTAMTNVMVIPSIGPVRPYALVGLGLIKTHAELTPSSVLTTTNNNLGWDLGGGVMLFFGSHLGIRGDVRYFHALQKLTVLGFTVTGEKLDFARAGAGLVLKF
jgi:opacity protein-like surface antigen